MERFARPEKGTLAGATSVLAITAGHGRFCSLTLGPTTGQVDSQSQLLSCNYRRFVSVAKCLSPFFRMRFAASWIMNP